MNIESGRRGIGLILALWCVTAFAGGELADPAVGGDWNADATWSGGVRPQSGETVVVKPTADAKVTLSADDSTDYKSLTFYSSSAINQAASIEFDGNGKTLAMPYSEAGNYDAKPFVFLDGNGKNILYVNDANLSEGDKTKAAPVRLTNAHFTLSQTADGSSTFVLDRGKMDFCTDAGDASANREVYLAHGLAKTLTVAVANATIEVPKFFSAWNGTGLSYFFDHATFISHGLAKLAVDNGYYYKDCDIEAKNSTFNFLGGAFFGRGENKTFEDCTITGGAIDPRWTHNTVFKNCTMNLTGCMDQGQGGADQWKNEFFLTFDGGTYAFGDSYVGAGGGLLAKMTITGGATVEYLKDYKTTAVWGATIGGRGTGVVEVVSGSLRTPAANYSGLVIGKWADQYGVGLGQLYVRGGKVDVGAGASAGETDGLVVGGQAAGEIHISGGEIRAPRLSIGFEPAGERISGEALDARLVTTSFVHQTGGKIDLGIFKNAQYACFGVSSYSGSGAGKYDDRDTKQRAAYYFEGGELEAGRLFGGMGSRCRGGTGYSLLSADGGTFRVVMPRGSWTTLTGFDRCEVGARGLTIDSNNNEVKVEQDIVNKDGVSGRLVKTGLGTLLYSGNLTAADLIVSGGVWQVVSGGVSSHVTLTPGTIFSTAGDVTDVTVAGLTLTNATLRLDPGDVITVNGPLAWQGLVVQFTSAPTKDEVQAFFKVRGELDESALATLRHAFFNVALADGTHARFGTSSEEGVTTVTVTVVDDVDPIGPEDTVQWSGSGSWSTSANWTPATVPGVANKAAFDSDSAGKEVSVDTDALVGAITFGTGGYTLVGEGSIEIAAEQGAAEIGATTAGTNTVDVPLVFDTVVNAPLAAGAKVALSQPIAGGGINKTGLGTLALGADNNFTHGLTLNGGWTELATSRSLGASEVAPAVLKAGGLRFDNANKTPIVLTRAVQTAAGDNGLVLEAETEATVPFTSEDGWGGGDDAGGYLYKRGTGGLTLELQRNTWITQGSKTPDYSWGIVFDENGLASPDSQVKGSLTVAEGLVRLAPKAGLDFRPRLTLTHDLFVGGIYKSGRANPTLELDGVALTVQGGGDFQVGGGMYVDQTPNMTAATLRLTNNASVISYYGKIGQRSGPGVLPTLEMYDSEFLGYVQTYLGGQNGSATTRVKAVNSTFQAGEVLLIVSVVSADFTNSTLCANGGNRRIQFAVSYSWDRPAGGYMRFADGSRLEMQSILWHTTNADHDKTYLKDFKLVFDDGTWDIGDADLTLSDTADPKVNLEKFSVELQAGGLKLPVAAGRTISTDARFWGEGGIEKSGEGTLKFGPGAYQFKGPMCALAGTVDLSGAGTITNGCFGAGAGTIADGTFKDPVFRLDAGAPNLVNCTFAGRGYLDVGDEPPEQPYPTDMTVLRFTGTAPDVSNWRLRGAGKKGLGAKFTVVGNEVKVTIEERGLLLLVR